MLLRKLMAFRNQNFKDVLVYIFKNFIERDDFSLEVL